ncbi:prepilin-type N-terminal cleavage/methylation domain-containing protein, partial [Acetobacteraceae bacterium]|nr:prepilin-type N-terminal cleavage/methylation domain-containing protein [Candidatus Parcubacteria bacterium]
KGFTLIEILIVIGIIAILAAIVIIAINPAKQFAQARNTQRESGINSILNAIGQRMADNKGVFEGTFDTNKHCDQIPTGPTAISNSMGNSALGNATGNLGCLVPTYIPALPTEPLGTGSGIDQYTIELVDGGRVEVCAPESDDESAIPNPVLLCVTR